MSTIVLGVGDFAAANQSGDELKTYALGSCVAVIFLDPDAVCVGMDHVALPESSINQERAREKPGCFADTGIPALLELMKKYGSNGGGPRMIVKLVGGASVMDSNKTFNIGKRNVLAIKKILWRYRMGAVAEHVGGEISRTVTVDVDNGQVLLSSPGRQSWEI
jgi:chemotaxis protein CheD